VEGGKDDVAVDIHPYFVFGLLTLVITGAALALTPTEKRAGFFFHVAIVTVLTLFVIRSN